MLRHMKDFRSLSVWERSHQFVLRMYKEIDKFPKYEKFRLSDQLIRASYSIPMNIAEGSGRQTDKDFARFIQISIGSACEVEYQLLLLKDLEMLDVDTYDELIGEIIIIRKMLINLVKKLRK